MYIYINYKLYKAYDELQKLKEHEIWISDLIL